MLLLLITFNMHSQKYNTWCIRMCEGACTHCVCMCVLKGIDCKDCSF